MMKKALLFFVLLLSIFSYVNSLGQNWKWAKGANCGGGPTNSLSEGWLVKTDHSDNVYAAFFSSADSICLGTNKIYCSSALGENQIVIVKYDTSGNVLWARASSNINTSTVDVSYPTDMTTDLEGNIYLFGYSSSDSFKFGNTVIRRPFSTVFNFCFVIKLDANGNALWAVSGGGLWQGSYTFSHGGIAVDSYDNVYIAASYRDHSIQFGTYILTNTGPIGTDDFFVVKYNSSGNLMWAKNFGSTGNDEVHGLIVDADNKIYLTGQFSSSSIVFGTTTLNYFASHPAAYNHLNIYWAKLDSSGNPLWAKSAAGNARVNAIAVDKTNGVYIGGGIEDTIMTVGTNTFYNKNSFLIRYDVNGNVDLVKAFTSTWNTRIWGITVDPCNNVWVSGSMDTISGFRIFLDSATSLSSPAGSIDPLYIAEYSASGVLLDYKTLPSGGDDNSGMAADRLGNIYLTGDFYGVDPFIVGNDSLHLPSNFLESFFIAKYRPNLTCELETPSLVSISSQVYLFPNPTNSSVTITASTTPYPAATIIIHDLTGRLMLTQPLTGATTTISTTTLPPGMYLCRIDVDGTGVVSRKLVVMK